MVARRIVVVISSLGGGGAERVVVDLCGWLSRNGRQVTLLTLSGDDPDAYRLPETVRRVRMEVLYSPYFPGHSLVFTAVYLRLLRRTLLVLRPDVVVSLIDQTNIRVLASLLGTGIPVIVSERTNPARHPLAQPWNGLRLLLYPLAFALLVQTDNAKQWFDKTIPWGRTSVIPNSVRPASHEDGERPVAPREAIVLAVGRLASVKGFDMLLDAFAQSGIETLGWKLVILGEGPERQSLQMLAGQRGISSLELPGYVENVDAWFRRAGIVALTSRYEGFPNVLLEAMQSGCACASFDCPFGPSEIITHNHDGLLIAAEDVAAMAAALQGLATDGALRKRLGDAAQGVADRFSVDKVYNRWLALIDRAGGADQRVESRVGTQQ